MTTDTVTRLLASLQRTMRWSRLYLQFGFIHEVSEEAALLRDIAEARALIEELGGEVLELGLEPGWIASPEMGGRA